MKGLAIANICIMGLVVLIGISGQELNEASTAVVGLAMLVVGITLSVMVIRKNQ